MRVNFVYFDRSYKNLRPEIDLSMQRVLSSGDLILRKDVETFEENFASFVGTKYAVSVSSGTDALYLALQALQLNGKRIAVPSHTFKATAGAVVKIGAIPVVYDMDGLLTGDDTIGHNDPGIIVHIAGELSPIRKDAHWPIIEDACQALGAVKNPTTRAQCWSFYPAKILGAFGDAGAVTTNDRSIYEYVRGARNHFKEDNRDFGGNHRMDNLQAAILNVKMKYLPCYLKRRKEVAEMYLQAFKDLPIGLPNNTQGRVWQDFIIQIREKDGIVWERDKLYEFLKNEGIETMKNEYPWTLQYPKLPLAEKYEAETLRLPCNSEIMDEEISYVIQKVKEFFYGKNFIECKSKDCTYKNKIICPDKEHTLEFYADSLIQNNGVKCKKCGAIFVKIPKVL